MGCYDCFFFSPQNRQCCRTLHQCITKSYLTLMSVMQYRKALLSLKIFSINILIPMKLLYLKLTRT